MNTNPLVSVLMISYNNVGFFKKAIDSVIEQTYKNWELIISDDGSTDGAWELAERMSQKDARIKAFRNASQLGIPKNRHAAFTRSSGEYVCHVDGDDELYPFSIQTMVETLSASDDIALAQSDNAWINDKGEVYGYHNNKDPDLKGNLSEAGWRHFGMYKRWAYDRTDGYNTKLINACEDGDLFMQIVEKFKYVRVPAVLYKHRWHGKNMSFETKKCGECNERPVCNYIRVWSKHVGYDPITLKPLDKQEDKQNDASV